MHKFFDRDASIKIMTPTCHYVKSLPLTDYKFDFLVVQYGTYVARGGYLKGNEMLCGVAGNMKI